MIVEKEVQEGQLLDFGNESILYEGLVVISQKQPLDPNDNPKYRVIMPMHDFQPELFDKRHILKLSEDISGEVEVRFTHDKGMPNEKQHLFMVTILLSDPEWNNLGWFESL